MTEGRMPGHALLLARQREVAEICRRHHVRRLSFFGSALGSAFDPERSDLDFVVEFQPAPPARHADAYFGLLQDLEGLFGRPIDLIESTAIRNPFIKREVEATQELVYAA